MQVFNCCVSDLQVLVGSVGAAFNSRSVCEEITIAQPELPKDELFFTRLVAWSYVALNEAFPVLLKQLVGVMRQSEPLMYKNFQTTKEVVECMRAYQSHNLPATSKRNEEKIKSVKIWKAINGGSPFSWEAACDALCNCINTLIGDLRKIWDVVSADQGDRENFLESLSDAFDKDWPAHVYDALVERSAISIGLVSFNYVAFRKRQGNVDAWRKLAALFEERSAAEMAVERAIKADLINMFGAGG